MTIDIGVRPWVLRLIDLVAIFLPRYEHSITRTFLSAWNPFQRLAKPCRFRHHRRFTICSVVRTFSYRVPIGEHLQFAALVPSAGQH